MRFDANPIAVPTLFGQQTTSRNIFDPNALTERFNRCMEEIDFRKIENVMQFLDWKWRDIGVPTQENMRNTCRYLFDRCLEQLGGRCFAYCATGGFVVEVDQHATVSVRFELQSWDEFGS